jgi:hypothetical protein
MTNAVTPEPMPFVTGKQVDEMTIVEISEQLERVTSWIEAQRVREREARAAYQAVAAQVEANVTQIKAFAQSLVDSQRRRLSSFDGLLGKQKEEHLVSSGSNSGGGGGGGSQPRTRQPIAIEPKNIGEAIMSIWTSGHTNEALTTDEIAATLPRIGYKSSAAPSSLKSSVNQALAKLCRTAKVVRFRSDGTRIPIRDMKSRARKYVAAVCLPEGEEP